MPARFSVVFLVTVALMIVLMVLSIGFLLQASDTYSRGYKELGLYYFMAGLMGIALSAYTLAQTLLRKSKIPKSSKYKVHTLAQCLKCGFRNLRPFRQGDYVLGPADPCPKCRSTTVILAIYRTS